MEMQHAKMHAATGTVKRNATAMPAMNGSNNLKKGVWWKKGGSIFFQLRITNYKLLSEILRATI